MPETDAPALTRTLVLRWVGFVVAVALGGLAVWLVTMGDSTRRVQLGVLAGLWGALLAAFAAFGSRRHLVHEVDAHELDSHQTGHGPRAKGPVADGADATRHAPDADQHAEIALRSQATELERAEEVARRRAREARLEQLLRREIQASVSREVAALRDEVVQLRRDLMEKVDGQLRLERIETTRVIGSDLEALQDEVRKLKKVTSTGEAELLGRAHVEPVRHVVEPARVRPVSRQTAEVESQARPARSDRADEPELTATSGAATAEAGAVHTGPAAEPQDAADEFAGLPRIRPFTEFDLDPLDEGEQDGQPAAGYAGRRHRADEDGGADHHASHAAAADGAGPGAADAEHAETAHAGTEHPGAEHPDVEHGSGGRRRAENAQDDVLARILARARR